jgi:hypothetical protein
MRLSVRQREIVSGFSSNLALLFFGFGPADQPVATLPMTWPLRGCMLMVAFGFLAGALWLERGRRRR